MSSKRKRVVLSVFDLKIMEKLKQDASSTCLARKYEVGNAVISDIKKNSLHVLSTVQMVACTVKLCKWPKTRTLILMCTHSLCRYVNKDTKLGGNIDLKAVTDWLERFKSTHKIRGVKLQDEKLQADTVELFKEFFKNKFDCY